MISGYITQARFKVLGYHGGDCDRGILKTTLTVSERHFVGGGGGGGGGYGTDPGPPRQTLPQISGKNEARLSVNDQALQVMSHLSLRACTPGPGVDSLALCSRHTRRSFHTLRSVNTSGQLAQESINKCYLINPETFIFLSLSFSLSLTLLCILSLSIYLSVPLSITLSMSLSLLFYLYFSV